MATFLGNKTIMATDYDTYTNEYEIEKLKAEILQEHQMKELLEKSSAEMKQTVEQLEKRIDSIDSEGNEWKTRFETQEEINSQLEKQITTLRRKIESTKQNIAKLKQPQNELEEEFPGHTPFMVQNLRKQKAGLENQIRDLEWRLEQESKAYHKANDERKQYIVEINTANFALDNMIKKAQREASESVQATSLRNIPEDQRVIDPKRGPIKKTAAVKNLPKLNDGGSVTARF